MIERPAMVVDLRYVNGGCVVAFSFVSLVCGGKYDRKEKRRSSVLVFLVQTISREIPKM